MQHTTDALAQRCGVQQRGSAVRNSLICSTSLLQTFCCFATDRRYFTY